MNCDSYELQTWNKYSSIINCKLHAPPTSGLSMVSAHISLIPRLSFIYTRVNILHWHIEGEGEPGKGKELCLPVASDDPYPRPCNTKHMQNQLVKVVAGHGWARFFTRLSFSSVSVWNICVSVNKKKERESLGTRLRTYHTQSKIGNFIPHFKHSVFWIGA